VSRTRICSVTPDDVIVRGRSLPRELIGKLSFTEMAWLQALGAMPTSDQTAILDACLVTMMEHGLTPSVIAARATYGAAPESIQGAVASGLLAVGATFAGSMEDCGRLLVRIVNGEPAETIVRDHRGRGRPVPGFGHPVHRPEDPRAVRLLALAKERSVAAEHCAALELLSRSVDAALGRPLPVNATGAFAAVLLDAGAPVGILRGFALVARSAGLVGHLLEEQTDPVSSVIADAAERAVAYEPK
jgi:citrate synthase